MTDQLLEIKIPTVGESVKEVTIVRLFKQVGDYVKLDEVIAEIETDKVTLEISAPQSGVLSQLNVKENQQVPVGMVVGFIKEASSNSTDQEKSPKALPTEYIKQEAEQAKAPLKDDLPVNLSDDRLEVRKPLSDLRLTVSKRLKEAQNTAAILTTFNEVDLSFVQNFRKNHKDEFFENHGVKLGLNSFFVKAVVHALQKVPILNSQIDGDEVVHKNYYDIGIAIAGKNGLVVPVIRDADKLNFVEVEKQIKEISNTVETNKLKIEDLAGGTFTITNGGIFGSLLSTPIINPPQSGILGLHKIQDRPVVIDGKIEIRPMMYLAISYDHRLIDGKEAVAFLVCIKDYLENIQNIGLKSYLTAV